MGTFFKGSSVGVSDPEDARLADQLATAQALRAKGLEGNTGAGYHGGKVFVVGNPWGNIASSIGGALLEHNARGKQQELLDRRNQQYEDYMRQMPSATEEQTYNPVENPGTGPLINGPVLKSARQQQQEMNRFALNAPNIPQFQALRQAGMLQALSAPEKQAAAEEAAANRKAMLEATLADRAASREERAAAERELERLRQEGRKELRVLAASLRPAPAPHNAQTVVSDQGILERQPDGTWKPITVGDKTAMKPSAGGGKGDKQKMIEEGRDNVTMLLDGMENDLKELNDAGGIVSNKRNLWENTSSRLQGSTVGQFLGGTIGTKEQTLRDNLESSRGQLLLELKNAKNLPAAMMNSNMELQRQLKNLGEGPISYETYSDILRRSRKLLNAHYQNTAAAEGVSVGGAAPRTEGVGTRETSGAIGGAKPSEPTVVRTGRRGNVRVEQLSDGTIREVK